VYFPQAVIVPVIQHTINRLGSLRIRLTRHLGNLAVRVPARSAAAAKRAPGGILIDRLYRIRMWIYLRKYFLAELGNFLDHLGPIIVLAVGGYLAIQGKAQASTLAVFISGLQKISDPWNQLINFYRTVSNTAVMHAMIFSKLEGSYSRRPAAKPSSGNQSRHRSYRSPAQRG
jgi:ABC-type multidrug transport system fused ATPase/permease subunit